MNKLLTILLLFFAAFSFGQTTCYREYYSNYDQGKIKDNTKISVVLLSEDYIPYQDHKYSNLSNYIIATIPDVITWKQCRQNSMSDIIDKHLKVKTKDYLKNNAQSIESRLKVTHKDKPEKTEKLKQKLMSLDSDNDYQDWRDMKDDGIKYMVPYFVIGNKNVLGWCEEIQ
jgi:hypothetical protein